MLSPQHMAWQQRLRKEARASSAFARQVDFDRLLEDNKHCLGRYRIHLRKLYPYLSKQRVEQIAKNLSTPPLEERKVEYNSSFIIESHGERRGKYSKFFSFQTYPQPPKQGVLVTSDEILSCRPTTTNFRNSKRHQTSPEFNRSLKVEERLKTPDLRKSALNRTVA